MRIFFAALVFFTASLLLLAALFFLFFIDTSPMTKSEYLYMNAKFIAFRYTGINILDESDAKPLYEASCARKCHSRDVIERARHTAREWEDVVQRMRLVSKANVKENESDVILKYLQKNFISNVPTILSPDANKYLKKYLWRSDFGESDLYVDVIYTPIAYHAIVGGTGETLGYNVDKHTIFLVYLNTHQNKLLPFQLDKLMILRDSNGVEYRPIKWEVTYESGDLHHREGVIIFPKVKTESGFIEIVLRDLPGQKERLFRWNLPIPPTPEK